jgi:hypothetical protein
MFIPPTEEMISLSDTLTKTTVDSPNCVIALHEPRHHASKNKAPRSSLRTRPRTSHTVRYPDNFCTVYYVERWANDSPCASLDGGEQDVGPVREMTKDIWYSRDEYDIIKARNSLIIKMMKTGNFEESNEHSFRGLEHKLKHGFKQRRSNKFAALNAVLEEQDRQMSHGINDQNIIAEKYSRVSLNAKETAFVTACRDVAESLNWAGVTITSENGALSNLTIEVVNQHEDDVSDMGSLISHDSEKQEEKLRLIFDRVNGKREIRMTSMQRRASA